MFFPRRETTFPMLIYFCLFLDDVYIRLKEGKRTRRSTEDSFHPLTYDFDLLVAGSKLNVHLTRNDHLSTNVPTLTLKRGSFKSQILHDNEVRHTKVLERSSPCKCAMFLDYVLERSSPYNGT